ncbi:MAG: DUF6089 family protein [Salibacteraceae bacterium]
MKQVFTLSTILGIFLAISFSDAQAQRWNRYKKEIGFSVGAANLMSDLGGGPNDGSRFGDFQIQNSRLAIGGFFKYRFHNRFAGKVNLIYAQLYADDKTTDNDGRRGRNLDVKTGLFEFSGQLEYYFLRERIGTSYKLKGVRGYGSSNISMYLFAGIGASYFNPQGTNESGEWVNLAPLNTEGQGLSGAPKDYSQMTMVFPLGLGIKYNITKEIGIQFEGGVRFTTSDYLDDASTNYYDGAALEAAYGTESKEMADKRYNTSGRHSEGGIRGKDEKKDAYLFGMLSLTYRLKSKARSRIRL